MVLGKSDEEFEAWSKRRHLMSSKEVAGRPNKNYQGKKQNLSWLSFSDREYQGGVSLA